MSSIQLLGSRPLRPWLIIPHTLVSNVTLVTIQMTTSCRSLSPSIHVRINMKDHRRLLLPRPRGIKSRLRLLLCQRTRSTRQNGARIFWAMDSVHLVISVTMSIMSRSFVRRVWCLPYHASLPWVLDFGKWISTVWGIINMMICDMMCIVMVCIWYAHNIIWCMNIDIQILCHMIWTSSPSFRSHIFSCCCSTM